MSKHDHMNAHGHEDGTIGYYSPCDWLCKGLPKPKGKKMFANTKGDQQEHEKRLKAARAEKRKLVKKAVTEGLKETCLRGDIHGLSHECRKAMVKDLTDALMRVL